MLFDPTRIGTLELKNRLMRSATAERLVTQEGEVTDQLVELYRALAKGDVGTIITGHTSVDRRGRAGWQMMSLEDDSKIKGLQRLTKTVHEYEAKILVQLNHCGRFAPGGLIGMNPLAVFLEPKDELIGQYPPKQATDSEIKELINTYGQAGLRARDAGFDGVQIHAAHGYLISQFLSGNMNKRADQWGGSLENRAAFLLAVIDAIKQQAGPDFPVWVKLNCDDFVDDPQGLKLEQSLQVAKLLKDRVSAIELSGGVSFEKVIRKGVPDKEPEAYFRPYALEFRKTIPDFPFILVGGIRSLAMMEQLLGQDGFALVSMSRPFIREPDLPKRLRREQKSACISCNLCLTKKTEPVKCRAIHNVNGLNG